MHGERVVHGDGRDGQRLAGQSKVLVRWVERRGSVQRVDDETAIGKPMWISQVGSALFLATMGSGCAWHGCGLGGGRAICI